MDDQKRRMELRDERAREWRTRRRDPGDLLTWSVVLGGFMAVILFLCSAYDGTTWLGAGVLVLLLAWVLVVWGMGKVNVLSVMWGRTIERDLPPDQARLVLGASGILALVSIAFPLMDLTTSLEFGWYGVIAGLAGVAYLVLMATSGRFTLQ